MGRWRKLPTKTKFDGILVDAPCSGLGTWQQESHARWTTAAKDVHELAEVQKKLLTHVAGSETGWEVDLLSLHGDARRRLAWWNFNAMQPEFEPMLLPELKSMAAPSETLRR